MNVGNSGDIWKLMNDYIFEIDPDSIYDDMSCSICKHLMIDACLSTCGCQYCYACVEDYVGNSGKYCPGNKLRCREEYLSIERDVIRDFRMNNRIFKTRMLCPNEWCDSKIELAQMSDHLKVCTNQTVECPFGIVGCEIGIRTTELLLSHLQSATLTHSELLLEFIHNVRNEVCGVKSSLEMCKLEIDSLKEESRMKEEQMKLEKIEMMEQMRQQNRETIAEMMKFKKEMMEDFAVNKEETEPLNMGEEMRQRGEDNRDESVILGNNEIQKRKNVRTQFCNVNEEIRVKLERMKDSGADFVWIVDGISKKKGKSSYSESFYSNNYKFCLCLKVFSGNIYFYCRIMRGDNDDKVKWPMRLPVTVSIINQDTMKTHMTETYRYDNYRYNIDAFQRSHSDMNDYGIGGYWSINCHSINTRSIIVNDAIIVSCVIDDGSL